MGAEGAWPVHPVEPGLRLRVVREMAPLPPSLDSVVERHWAAACARRPLFNGRVFSADVIGAGVIEGHWTEYRRVVAQMADVALRAVLGVRSLAVCGVICGPDGVAVGRREARSAYQQGLWQMPPAGSVDQGSGDGDGDGASWRMALMAELREEMGMGAEHVLGLRLLCVVEHPTGVLDLGVRIDTGLDRDALLRCHAAAPDQEYDRMMVVPPGEMAARVAAEGGVLVPSAMPFLRLAPG